MQDFRTFLPAFLIATLAAVSTVSAVDIIGHRGASADAPENTLPSFELAWKQGADAIELDLWLSTDGKLIVFHDGDTKRYEPKGSPARKITSLSLEEAQKLDVGAFKGAQFVGTHIPTLESVLATIPAGHRIVLELKDGPRIVPEFVRVLRASGRKPEEMCVISFKYDTLRESKHVLPEIEHYYLADYKADKKTNAFPDLEAMIAQAKEANFDGLNLSQAWPISKEFAAKVAAAKLKLLVWTVDDPAIAKQWRDAGAVAITTNKPGWLREQLK